MVYCFSSGLASSAGHMTKQKDGGGKRPTSGVLRQYVLSWLALAVNLMHLGRGVSSEELSHQTGLFSHLWASFLMLIYAGGPAHCGKYGP